MLQVKRERAKDAAQGNAIAIKLEGKISRPIVKQTAMTVVYGATRFGARLQIIKEPKGIYVYVNFFKQSFNNALLVKTELENFPMERQRV